MKRRISILLALCVLLTTPVALSGCSGDKAESASQIIVGIPQDLEDSLDPHKAVAAGTKEILFNLFEGLFKPDSEGNLIPALAKSYEVSEDGTVYTFILRKDVQFHNGNPVTAEDVKYSLEKIAGKQGTEPMIPAYSLMENISVSSDETVTVTLSKADPDFLSYLAMTNAAIIPMDNAAPDTNPIGTGPYCYVSRSVQEKIVLKRFDAYWGEKGKIENVILQVVPEIDTIVMNLRGGSIDMFARLTTDQVAQLPDSFNVMEGTMNLVQALYLNNSVPPLQDVRVRKAICYALNRQEILNLTSEGKGTIIGSSMFPAFGKYYLPELADNYPTDVEQAKALLAEAGYPNGFALEITVPSNYQPHVNTAQVVAEQLKRVGIKVSIRLVEWNTWLSEVYVGREYESTVIGVDASYLTAMSLLERFYSKADNNFINFSSEDYDACYERALTLTDEDEKTACYLEMERILSEEAANAYIQDMAEFVALNRKFGGYEFYPIYVQDFSKLYLIEEAETTAN